jgi:hypothetical protein
MDFGDNLRLPSKYGNPQRLSHNHETPDNPHGVWTLKKLADVSAAE